MTDPFFEPSDWRSKPQTRRDLLLADARRFAKQNPYMYGQTTVLDGGQIVTINEQPMFHVPLPEMETGFLAMWRTAQRYERHDAYVDRCQARLDDWFVWSNQTVILLRPWFDFLNINYENRFDKQQVWFVFCRMLDNGDKIARHFGRPYLDLVSDQFDYKVWFYRELEYTEVELDEYK